MASLSKEMQDYAKTYNVIMLGLITLLYLRILKMSGSHPPATMPADSVLRSWRLRHSVPEL